MQRYLIVGLGNPGEQYQGTRHNLGFMVLDAQAEKLNQYFSRGPGNYHWIQAKIGGSEVFLLKPMTYMNRSGIAVADAKVRLNVPLERCLIVLDDLALPLGQLRLRAKGSDGGHHGLASVLNCLHSQNIPRLRMGIGNADDQETVRFVLSPFPGQNIRVVKHMIEQAVQAVNSYVIQGIHFTMNAVNTSL
ncbi:aminoacyl-tRNA hydrolase [bacterium]|nr:aminoacyl-tRNA hydrolase [bacterium]